MNWSEFKQIVDKELGGEANNMELGQIMVSFPKHGTLNIEFSENSISIIDDEMESFFYDAQGRR